MNEPQGREPAPPLAPKWQALLDDMPVRKPPRRLTLWRKAAPHARMSVQITSRGLEVAHERPKVGGGWYVRDLLHCPWPWRTLS